MLKKRFSHYTCCKLGDLGCQEHRKSDAKSHPKWHTNPTLGNSNFSFEIWGVLGGAVILCFLKQKKGDQTIQTNLNCWRPGKTVSTLWSHGAGTPAPRCFFLINSSALWHLMGSKTKFRNKSPTSTRMINWVEGFQHFKYFCFMFSWSFLGSALRNARCHRGDYRGVQRQFGFGNLRF